MDVNGRRYRRKPKRYVLKFEDYPGLQVEMKGLSIEAFMTLAREAAGLQGLDVSSPGPQLEAAMSQVDSLFARFAGALVSWNLDGEDGKPVPQTVKGVRSQDLPFILEITLAWMDAIASVDIPLPQPANGQQRSPESSLLLANSSSSLST